jgi:hypothetical protein
MATSEDRPCAGDEIGREKERSPQFVLMHVRTLMRARSFQGPGTSADHDVAQRDGLGAAGQGCEPNKRTSKQRTMSFDHPVDDGSMSAPEQRECQREPEKGRGAGPQISQESNHERVFESSHN